MKKKILAILLTATCTVSLVFGLAGCGKNNASDGTDPGKTPASSAEQHTSDSAGNSDSAAENETGQPDSDSNSSDSDGTSNSGNSASSGESAGNTSGSDTDGQTASEAGTSSGQDSGSGREASTTLPVEIKGTTEEMPVSLYEGDGYSLYVPSEGLRENNAETGEEGLIAEWDDDTQDTSLQIIKYSDLTAEDAAEEYQAEMGDYSFARRENIFTGETEDGSSYREFTVYQSTDAAYVITWDFPSDEEEGFSERLARIAETFEAN